MSEAPGAVKRAVAAGLLPPGGLGVRPGAEALREFLVHGAKYSFPALRGEMARTDGLFRVSRITNTLPS
ncbi:MAG: hypothetical protein IPN83_23715 [Holophagales bacterium]|nr:hypothetical protein [Holophagales bacterium]